MNEMKLQIKSALLKTRIFDSDMKPKAIFSVIFSIGLGIIVTVETTLALGLFCGFAIMILQAMHMMLDTILHKIEDSESLRKEEIEKTKIDREYIMKRTREDIKEELGRFINFKR